MEEPLTSYFNEILQTDDPEALKALTSEILENYGFNAFSYIGFNPPTTENVPYINSTFVQSTYPKAWLSQYIKNDYLYSDPIIAYAKTSLIPFRWDGEEMYFNVTPAQKRVLNEGKKFGIARGVVVPVHAPRGEFAIFAMASNKDARTIQLIWETKKTDLHLIGIYYHAAVWENILKQKIQPTPILSPRELQCLQWAARGKTLWETSQILGISEGTAKTHLKAVLKKMDTSNKTHAVSKALVHGLISA